MDGDLWDILDAAVEVRRPFWAELTYLRRGGDDVGHSTYTPAT